MKNGDIWLSSEVKIDLEKNHQKNMSKEKNEIRKILDSIPEQFRVIEDNINQSAIQEFYDLRERITNNENEEGHILNSSKEELVRLAEIGDVKSYRRIEEIIQERAIPNLKEFAYVALKFARINLENQLSDEPIGFISSGLGGKGNKLRYYFVIKSTEHIGEKKELRIKNELKLICLNSDSDLETIENFGNYVLIKILVSIDFAIGNIIEQLIDKCNFADKEYFCTNVERPTNQLIEKWINDEI